jgi:hypothetical protein
MKQLIKYAALSLCLFACGGEADDPEQASVDGADVAIDEPAADDIVLGTAEQPITVKGLHGVNYNGDPYRCQLIVGTGGSDTCLYPRDTSRSICVTGTGMTAGQKTEAEADVDAILPTFASQFGGWAFSRSCSSPDVNLEYANISASQTSTSILGYVRVIPTTPTGPLVEPGTFPTFNLWKGSFYVEGSGATKLRVDRPQIVADFAAADQQRVRRHALYGGMYAALTGIGFTPDHTNRVTSIATTPATAKSTSVSTQEKCRVNGYTLSGGIEAAIATSGNCN